MPCSAPAGAGAAARPTPAKKAADRTSVRIDFFRCMAHSVDSGVEREDYRKETGGKAAAFPPVVWTSSGRSILEPDTGVPERAVHPEGTAIARVHLAVRRAARQRHDRVVGRIGDLVWIGVEQIARTDRPGVALQERIVDVEVDRELGAELLALDYFVAAVAWGRGVVRIDALGRIVVRIDPRAVVVPTQVQSEVASRPVARQGGAM